LETFILTGGTDVVFWHAISSRNVYTAAIMSKINVCYYITIALFFKQNVPEVQQQTMTWVQK